MHSKYERFSDSWISRTTWLWLHVVQLLLTFSVSEDALWERRADRDLLCPFLTCYGSSSAPSKQDCSCAEPTLPGLSYRSRSPNSTPVLLPYHTYLIMNILQQVRFFFFDLGTSAAWIWIMSTVVAFLLDNHWSKGWRWAVGMSKVQNRESLLFIPGGTSYSTETTELLVAFKAWVALYGPFVSFRGTAPHPIPQIPAAATLREARQRHMERC